MENLTKMLTSAYDKYCGEQIDESVEIYDPIAAELQITIEAARERISANSELALLDVREPHEIASGKIEGALSVDNELGNQIVNSWPQEREIIERWTPSVGPLGGISKVDSAVVVAASKGNSERGRA